MVASLTTLSLVLQAKESSITFSDVIKYGAPILSLLSAVVAFGCLLTLLKYRVNILEKNAIESKKAIDETIAKSKQDFETKIEEMREEFHNEFRLASTNLSKATSDIQLIASNQNVIQKLTTDTLGGILNRIEEHAKINNDHTTMLALINKDINTICDKLKGIGGSR